MVWSAPTPSIATTSNRHGRSISRFRARKSTAIDASRRCFSGVTASAAVPHSAP